jgi:hypothetical protein
VKRALAALGVAVAFGACSLACNDVKRPEQPTLRAAYDLLAYGCTATRTGGPDAEEVLLKTWLGVHGRYPYETNLIRAASETKPDAQGKYYGELTADEVRSMDACRARADHVAGIDR